MPSQELEHLVRVTRDPAGTDRAINISPPASTFDWDRRLRVRASFLPGRKATVKQKLEHLEMHKMDIVNGGVLERGCVYIVPLLEGLALKKRTSAMGNPKSSTGRLDVFIRLITDYGTEFDRVREGYNGPLYAEVSPRTFSVLVRKGSRLNQLRIRRGNPSSSDESMKRLQQQHQVVASIRKVDIRDGVPVSVDVQGDKSGGVIGYRARSHAGLIDIDKLRHYDVLDYWEAHPCAASRGLVLIRRTSIFWRQGKP